MAYYAIYNKYGVHTGGVREDLYAFASKQARDEWVADNELGANDALVAESVTRAQAINRVGVDMVNIACDAIARGDRKVKACFYGDVTDRDYDNYKVKEYHSDDRYCDYACITIE